MKGKGFITAAILVFTLCLAATVFGQPGTAGQIIPGQPSGSGQPNIPVQPGTPDLTGASAPLSLPAGQRYEIKPYVFVTEQYTSNVYLTNTNTKSDWITTAGPGIRLAVNDPSFGADLTGNFGYNWYANQTKEDYWSIDGTLGLRYNPTPQLTFRVREYILRSENTVEPYYAQGGQPAQPGNLVGTNRSNTPYLRNVVEPSVDWQFSRQGNVGLLYRNNILRNDDNIVYEDSTENYVRPSFSYWIDQRNNIALDYGFTSGTYSREVGIHTPDFTSQNPHGRYTFRFDAQMSVFADYIFIYQDNDDPGIDYTVNNPSVGIVYNFNPTLTGVAQLGYFWQNPERGDDFTGVTSNLSITQRDRQTTYTLAFNSGFQQNQFSFDNTGFNKYYGGSALISHQITQRFNVGFVGSAVNTEYAGLIDRTDWLYTADATAGYQILQWLTVGGRVGYQQDDSNIAANSYEEWHAFLTLTATFDNLLK